MAQEEFMQCLQGGDIVATKKLMDTYDWLDLDNRDQNGWTSIFHALNDGYVDIATALAKDSRCDLGIRTLSNCEMNKFDILDSGASILHMAIQMKHNIEADCLTYDINDNGGMLPFIELILLNGAYPDSKTKHGRTPIHYALIYGDQADVIETLIKHKANVEMPDSNGNSPLFMAVGYSKLNCIKSLIKHGAGFIKMEHKQTVLHLLFDKDETKIDYDIAKLLVDAQCPLNDHDIFGDTPLHIAINNCNAKAVRFLIESGSDISVKTKDPEDHAFENQYPDMADLLSDRLGEMMSLEEDQSQCDNYAALHQVVFCREDENSQAILELLMASSDDINIKTKRGKTALMMALSQNKLVFAKMLIDAGCDANIQDNNGWSALHVACKKFNKSDCAREMLQEIIRRTTDLNLLNRSAETPLHIACDERKPSFAYDLLKAGANVHFDDLISPLELAIRNFDINTSVVCLQAGCQLEPDIIKNYTDELQTMEMKMMKPIYAHALQVFLFSGHKFDIAALVARIHFDDEDSVKHAELVLKYTQSPLSLKRQAANCVRNNLYPNSFFAIDKLVFPPGVEKALKCYVTMDGGYV